jgi:NAD(P)-dependent dehydrogenase (short-subunit alcohol dehydrogenase family)/acyl carrier protein
VCDSRSLLFRDEILSATGGAGVNVVVNALTGDAVDASLSLLRAGGYFVELGKRELRSPEELSRAFPGVRYVAFDLFDKIDRDPGTYAAAFAELARQLESGRLVPLPSVSFPHTRAVDAFRLMTRAGHIGKILLAFPRRNRHVMTVRSDATYLITGGTGAVGLETASWLVQRGARSVVLASRRAPNARAAERIATLREMGAEIVWRAADLTSMESVRGLVAECGSSGLPLRGVVHAAGLLDDGLLADLTPPRFAAPFGPKVIGAWHLAQCLDADSLDFLFLYSAAGSLIDPAGQSNYASANAVIDALAAYLRESGYPATSVAWGLWQDGMAMQLTSSQVGRWHAQGLRPIGGGVAAALLDRVLTTDRATVVPLLIDWPRHFAGRADPDPLVFELGAQVRGRPASESLVSERLRALPVQRRQAALRDYLIQCVGRVLGRGDLEEVGPNRPLRDLGLDSLMAVELRNTLTRELGCPLSATLAFDYPDVPALTVHLGTLLFGATQLPPEREKAGTLTAAEPVELGDDVDGAIAAMTDEEAERQLLEELSVGSADMGVRS